MINYLDKKEIKYEAQSLSIDKNFKYKQKVSELLNVYLYLKENDPHRKNVDEKLFEKLDQKLKIILSNEQN
jgi:hypothetical protein